MRLRNPNRISRGEMTGASLLVVALAVNACAGPRVSPTPDERATMGAVGTRVYLTSEAQGTDFSSVQQATEEGASIAATMNAVRTQVSETMAVEQLTGTPTPECIDLNVLATTMASVDSETRDMLASAVPGSPVCTATPGGVVVTATRQP